MEPPDPEFILRGFDNAVTTLTFVSDELNARPELLLTGTHAGSVYVWDLRRRRIISNCTAVHSSSVLSVAFISDSDEIISQGREGAVCRWKMQNSTMGNKLSTYQCASHGFCPVAVFQLNNQPVLAVPTDRQPDIAIVSIETGETIATMTTTEQIGMPMDMKATDSGLLVVGYEDGSVALWDTKQPNTWTCREKFHDEAVAGLDYCDTTHRGVSGSVDGGLVMYECDGSALTKVTSVNVDGGVACVRGRSDGKLFAVGCCNHGINLYSGRKKMQPLVSVCAHSETVSCLAFGSNQRLAAGSRDKTVSMWNLYCSNASKGDKNS